MAIKANISIDQGADFQATIDVTESDGTPFDLTGYTGRAQMRKSYSSSTYKDFSVGIGANTLAGELILSMNSTTTTSITPGRWLWDVEIVSNTNVVTRVAEGIATVNPEITKS